MDMASYTDYCTDLNGERRYVKDIHGNIYDINHIPPETIFEDLDLSCMRFTELPESLATCKVKRRFVCSHCINLTSLKNLPKDIKILDCSNCWDLSSLEGCHDSVEILICHDCHKLPSLKGISKNLRKLDCSVCWSIPDLKGCCSEVLEEINCYRCTSLGSLEGCRSKALKSIYCGDCCIFLIPDNIPDNAIHGLSDGEIAMGRISWGLGQTAKTLKTKLDQIKSAFTRSR